MNQASGTYSHPGMKNVSKPFTLLLCLPLAFVVCTTVTHRLSVPEFSHSFGGKIGKPERISHVI